MMDGLDEFLERALERTPGVLAGYLFGSTVEGGARPPADLDLAVLWVPEMTPLERFGAAMDLAGRVEAGLSPRRPVDVVDLADAPPALLLRAVTRGRLVFERDRARRVGWEAAASSRAIDFLTWQRPFLARWLERVARG